LLPSRPDHGRLRGKRVRAGQPERSRQSGRPGAGPYDEFAGTGADLSVGPCISESLPGLPDWVVDIAHDPRQSIDDVPENQCQRYRDGEAEHFVELDEDGTLIKAE
jgi:hypothetical protein